MRNFLSVSIALLFVIYVTVISSYSHDAVVAYDNAKDYLYFVRDGTVYRGDLTTNDISEVFVNDATDSTLIQLFPNGDGILVRGPETFKLITLPDNRIIYEGKNNYTQQPFSPSGRYFAYNNPDKGQVLRIDLKTGNEDVWVENVHPTLEFFYGWDDESIFEFYDKDVNGRIEHFYKCWCENTEVKEEMIYFSFLSQSYYGSRKLSAYVASNQKEFIDIRLIYEHYMSKTGLFLRFVGGNILYEYKPDVYLSAPDKDYYNISNSKKKVFLFTMNSYEYKYNDPPYIKVFDLYENYELDYWKLNDQYDADVLKYRGLNQCQFDLASQNIIVWDRIDQSLYRISWFSTNEFKINREVDIQLLDKQPTIVISKVNNFVQL